ncbi:MAG: prophage endopeptidase tail family protein [bacterium]|nr:prophage endopeptidase tail family protein [bacterium]
MLKLWAANVINPYTGIARPETLISVLHKASEVAVKHEINKDYTLEFKYPKGEAPLTLHAVVEYEGQLFRIKKLTASEDALISVQCEHIFMYDAKRCHIPNVASTDSGDFIGEDAYSVLEAALKARGGTIRFMMIETDKLHTLGMSRIDTAIDFESMDKTNLYDVVMAVIEKAGMGELYVDNYSFAVVNRLGADKDIVIAPGVNLSEYTIERDASEVVRRLYPYGKDNMEITNVCDTEGGEGLNPERLPYIESPLIGTDGEDAAVAGCAFFDDYADYSDCTDPVSLYNRARWELDENNPDRIDKPSVNISGKVTNCRNVGIGDRVCVLADGETIFARVISLTRYPYEPQPDSMSIGSVKKDMYYYLNRVGLFTKRYRQTSTTSGTVQGNKISGTVSYAKRAASASAVSAGSVSVNNTGIKIYGTVLTADSDGNLYINGAKAAVENGTEAV